MEKTSYECHVYESVDDRSPSWVTYKNLLKMHGEKGLKLKYIKII